MPDVNVPVVPLIVLGVVAPIAGGLLKSSVPPSVILPLDVTVPVKVKPLTVPVPLTDVTVPCGLAAVVMLVTRPYVSIVTTGISVADPVVPAVAIPLTRSITGVVPPVEVILPAVPLTEVTVPVVGVVQVGAPAPLDVRTWPDVPTALSAIAEAVEYGTAPALAVKLALVPPLAKATCPVIIDAGTAKGVVCLT